MILTTNRGSVNPGKVLNMTIPGPLNPPFTTINIPFRAGSISVKNRSTRDVYLGSITFPTTSANAIFTIGPLVLDHITNWQSSIIYVSASGALAVGDYVSFQILEEVIPTPAGSQVPNVIQAGDNTPNPYAQAVLAYTMGYDDASASWFRIRMASQFAAPIAFGALAAGMYFSDSANQTNRPMRAANLGDGVGSINMPVLSNYVHDSGSGFWNRMRDGTAANIATVSPNGGVISVEPGHFTIQSAPAAGVQASGTRGAIASTRHVLRTITAACYNTAATGGFNAFVVAVRDGATGVGTILWETYLIIPGAVAGQADRFTLSGLSIPGSVNTAMTVEFNAGVANVGQVVAATGYDAT